MPIIVKYSPFCLSLNLIFSARHFPHPPSPGTTARELSPGHPLFERGPAHLVNTLQDAHLNEHLNATLLEAQVSQTIPPLPLCLESRPSSESLVFLPCEQFSQGGNEHDASVARTTEGRVAEELSVLGVETPE